jgi:hypothetical protein
MKEGERIMKELKIKTEELKVGDRVHFFWAYFPDGNVINGGNDILGVSFEVPKPKKEWVSQVHWTKGQLEEFENLRKGNRLMLVTLKTDYYDPSTVVMERDKWLTVYRD